jgi:CheY-like chemotaxis protein
MAEKQKHIVLVVEDVEEISANMAFALNKLGHRVMRASSAEQAIQIAEVDRPAMILTDLDLPTFDNLLSLLRGHDDLKNVVVAIIDINNPIVTDSSVNVLSIFKPLTT